MAKEILIDSIVSNLTGKSIGLLSDISYNSTSMILSFILDGLNKGQTVCILSLIYSNTDLIEKLNERSDEAAALVSDAILNDKVRIIDGYSFRAGIDKDDVVPGTTFLYSTQDLTMMSIYLNKISSEFSESRFVIWPISLMALYNNTADLIGFLQSQIARFSKRKQVCLFVIDRFVLNQREEASIRSSARRSFRNTKH